VIEAALLKLASGPHSAHVGFGGKARSAFGKM